jgi:hypothetical protein
MAASLYLTCFPATRSETALISVIVATLAIAVADAAKQTRLRSVLAT